jgi:threonine synthase
MALHLLLAIVNSINPFRIDGQKTAAFEIVDALGKAPDYHCLPVGNAGNITAYWKGYSEYATETSIFWAASIFSSTKLSNQPPDSFCAAQAKSQD